MKKFALGFAVGLAVAIAGTAGALTRGQSVQLAVGDRASFGDGLSATNCAVVSKQGIPAFSCFVGDDQYRKRFGVTINEREVTVNQYFGRTAPKPYKVIFRRIQTSSFKAY